MVFPRGVVDRRWAERLGWLPLVLVTVALQGGACAKRAPVWSPPPEAAPPPQAVELAEPAMEPEEAPLPGESVARAPETTGEDLEIVDLWLDPRFAPEATGAEARSGDSVSDAMTPEGTPPSGRGALLARSTLVSRRLRYAKVFYGTSRARGAACRDALRVSADAESGCLKEEYYGVEPGPLEVGWLRVTFPEDHVDGEIERPFEVFKLRLRREDPDEDVVLAELHSFGGDLEAWAAEVRRTERSRAFLYVHGFATTFEESAWRAAQLAYDIEFPGVPMLYSWPSKGGTFDYVRDYDVVQLAIEPFQRFLHLVADRTGLEEVHVISHSMGNQLVAFALREMAVEGERIAALENAQLVLAAPDIDAEVFRTRFAEHLPKLFKRVTLYVSDKDRALRKARQLRDRRPRAGEAIGGLLDQRFERIEIIDASSLDTDFLSHSYYANNDSVRSDMFCLITAGVGAARRPLLELEAPSWRFKTAELRRTLRADDCGLDLQAGAGAVPTPQATRVALDGVEEPELPIGTALLVSSLILLALVVAWLVWRSRRRRSVSP